jgi:hypothetical protein
MKGIEIVLLSRSKVVIDHLLWKLIYKGATVLEWFLLFDFLSKNEGSSEKYFFACLFGVLKESACSRKGQVDFYSQLRPIQRVLLTKVPKGENSHKKYKTLFDFVISKLSLPQQGMASDKLYTSRVRTYQSSFPRKPNRIGVGYKDKGSLGPVNRLDHEVEVLDPSDNFESFESVWKRISSKFSSLKSPPPLGSAPAIGALMRTLGKFEIPLERNIYESNSES